MRILTRTLGVLTLAIALGAVLAGSASAASLTINGSIQGSGSWLDIATIWTCSQSPPVSDREVKDCGSQTVPYSGSGGPHTVRLVAASNAGWTFQRWAGCDSVAGSMCFLDVPSGRTDRTVDPRPIFKDRVSPSLTTLSLIASNVDQGRYTVNWSASELGVIFKCALDGGAAVPCDSGYSFTVPEGRHTLGITPEDRSGNVGATTRALVDVFETVLDEAPAEGAYVATWRFAAHTGLGSGIECSIDRGRWFDCGGASGPLTLPALADGSHTLRARGVDVASAGFDRVPATRAWTVDTTAPDTTLTDFKLGANEPVASFRCRVDGADVPCTTILPSTPGTHTFEAAAVDHAGNVDPTPAKWTWTVEVPAAQTVLVPTRVEVPAAAKPVTLDVFYSYSGGRLTRLVVSGPGPIKLTVKRPGRRATATSVKKLVGKRLPKRTKITVHAGDQRKTITLR